MPNPTPELGLLQALDGDDAANYLDTSLANSLFVVDALFNNVSGHTHGAVHQGGPISAVPVSAISDGSITSAKLTDGTIQTVDLADGIVTTPKIAASVTLTSPTLNTPTINNPTISGAIAGNPTFSSGPHTSDWFRNAASGTGIVNDAVSQGIAFDATGAYAYPSGDRLVGATAAQTLTNKTLSFPSGGILSDGGSGYVQISQLTVTPGLFAAGNTNINGTLTVQGTTTMGSSLAVTGNVTASGNLTATGNLGFNSAFTVSPSNVVASGGTHVKDWEVAINGTVYRIPLWQ